MILARTDFQTVLLIPEYYLKDLHITLLQNDCGP